jgi:hypothetical protein
VKVCVSGLLMSKAGIGDGSSTALSICEYIADDDDILKAYRTLGIWELNHIIGSNATNVICLVMNIIFIVF